MFAGDPEVQDATMVDFNRSALEVYLSCDPSDDASEVGVNIPLDCAGHADALEFDLLVDGPRTEGRSVFMRGPFSCYYYY